MRGEEVGATEFVIEQLEADCDTLRQLIECLTTSLVELTAECRPNQRLSKQLADRLATAGEVLSRVAERKGVAGLLEEVVKLRVENARLKSAATADDVYAMTRD